jgi:hypothetical protein
MYGYTMNPKTSVSTASKSGVGAVPPETEGMDAWLKGEKERQQEQLREKLKEKGLSPYIRFEVGETKIKLTRGIPAQRVNNYGKTVRDFIVQKDGETYTWSVSEASPLFRKLLDVLSNGREQLTVVRVGTGTDTKYDLK